MSCFCCVCLSQMVEQIATLPCGHVFHSRCIEQSIILKPQCPLCRTVYGFTEIIHLKVKLLTDKEEEDNLNQDCPNVDALQSELQRKADELNRIITQNSDLEKSISSLQYTLSEERKDYVKLKYIHAHTGNTKDIYIKEIEKLKEQIETMKVELSHIRDEKDITNKIEDLLVNPISKEFKEWADTIKKTKKPQESAQIFYKASLKMMEKISNKTTEKQVMSNKQEKGKKALRAN